MRVYGYRRLTPAADARVLARFDDGQPALVERTIGSGRMLVWTSGFDLAWNDLALKPVFLPFVHQTVRTLAAFRERPTSITVGQVAALDRRAGGGERVAVEPSGKRTAARPGSRRRPRGDDARLLRGARAGQDQAAEAVVAANVDLTESDLAGVDPAEVTEVVAGAGTAQTAAGGRRSSRRATR